MNYPAQNAQQGNIEKNPNGGYLNKNQYGLYGNVDVTPELLAEIHRTGKVMIKVNEPQMRGSGNDTWESARCTLKPYVPKDQGYAAAPAPQGYAPAPVAAQHVPHPNSMAAHTGQAPMGYQPPTEAERAQMATPNQPTAPAFQDEIPW